MKIIYLSILLAIICYAKTANSNPIAHIGDSQVIGHTVRQTDLEANQYLGVPYAEPPVGNLRFMKTKPIVCLPKVLSAVHQPPACQQYTTNPFPWYINGTQKSEDCLYLNIWTPTNATPQNTKAVLYWIHGGGFRYGSIRDDLYSGIPLAALGDIVVVTVNYRLGPFGFLSSGTEDAPGNAGLWDILEGLRWVNRNIRAFGGDPARITIAGESAGSILVAILNASPLGKGLFARQIMQSGSPSVSRFEDNNKRNILLAQDLATLVGCANETYTINNHPSNVVQCMKDVDDVTLSRMDSLIMPHSSADFFPQYGDEIIPTKYHLGNENEDSRCSDLLIGVNRDEGSVFLATDQPDFFGFFGLKNPQINKTAGQEMMRKMFPTFPQLEALIDHYLPETLPENAYEEVTRQLHTSLGDMGFVCASAYAAERCSDKGNSVFFYLWMHRPNNIPWAPWTGVPHFCEVEFVFGQPVLSPKQYPMEEVEISMQMIEMWTNFIKYGKPSAGWPLYRKNNPNFKYIGPGTETDLNGVGPHRKSCDFLRPFSGF